MLLHKPPVRTTHALNSFVYAGINKWNHLSFSIRSSTTLTKFKTYENFRLKKIRMLSQVNEWRFVPTKCNPADVTSKGLEAGNTKGWDLFHQGPSFLLQNKSEWPLDPMVTHADEEEKGQQPCLASVSATVVETLSASALATPIELMAVGATKLEPEIRLERPQGVDAAWPLKATKRSRRSEGRSHQSQRQRRYEDASYRGRGRQKWQLSNKSIPE